jgi:hypothetical protein
LTLIGGSTFAVVPLPRVGDGERVDVSISERISCGPQRQLSRPLLACLSS